MKFLLQLENNGHFAEDTAVVARIIDEQNWLHGICAHSIASSSYSNLIKNACEETIPVGSIEFVDRVLKLGYNKPPMKPINIPECLNCLFFCQRKTSVVHSKDALLEIFKLWKRDTLFIKSASMIKAGYTDFYKSSDNIPDDTDYFVSEPIDIVSEWRVFVNRGSIIDIKNYNGDPWVVPNKEVVLEAVKTIGNSLTSYTLDVGVLDTGDTAVIEVHNFVSCGLYGFDRPVLLQMLNNGFNQELSKEGNK